MLCTMILFEWLLLHFSSRTNSKQLLPWAGKPHSHSWKIVAHALIWLNEILQLPWCYIRIQFELTEVAKTFPLWPGNKASMWLLKTDRIQVSWLWLFPVIGSQWLWLFPVIGSQCFHNHFEVLFQLTWASVSSFFFFNELPSAKVNQ